MATQHNKRATVISTEVKDGSLHITFPRIGKFLVVQPGNLSLPIIEQATLHGLRQKLIDAAAIARDPDSGKSASDMTKFEAVKTVYDRITTSDEWNTVREGGEGGASLLLRALVRFHEGRKTKEQLAEWLKTRSEAEKKALGANPKILSIVAAIKAESVDQDIDSDALLDEAGE